MEIRPTLFIISEDKTLTMHTMSKLYDLIKKRAVKSQYEPCNTVTFQAKVCTFWSYAEEEKGLSFKVIVASSQCSDQECNKIVLWECCVCKNPCSECFDHVRSCHYCGQGTCKDCHVNEDDDMCKNCGYRCVVCASSYLELDDNKMMCEGPDDGPCLFTSGPFCLDCSGYHNGTGPNINFCSRCNRMACVFCDCIFTCAICDEIFCCDIVKCSRCRNHACIECDHISECQLVRDIFWVSFLLIFGFFALTLTISFSLSVSLLFLPQ
jgi:hypothetical protein